MNGLTAKLVNRLTAKLNMNRLTANLVDHLTAKLVVVNLVKLHLTKFNSLKNKVFVNNVANSWWGIIKIMIGSQAFLTFLFYSQGSNLSFATASQSSLPQSVSAHPVVVFRVSEVDDQARQAHL